MKRSRRSVAWDHFDLKGDLVYCRYCKAVYKYKSSTTQMMFHLNNAHPTLVNNGGGQSQSQPSIDSVLARTNEFVSSASMISSMLDPRHKHLGFLSPAQRVVASAKLVNLAEAVETSEVAIQQAGGDEVASNSANTGVAASVSHVSAMAHLLGDHYTTHCETGIDAEFQNFLS
ncbi:hypothetical protein ACEWY4_016889 [Coilia grayii]|uniref:BED-type domain-containing protein n=1 Tax=Coilia grayii TaxID=363190 RepID=A0ABD1JLP0_9TELE